MTEASHKRRIVVWDVPPANDCGAVLPVQIGIKCDSHCAPDDWRLEVHDHVGHRLASVTVGRRTWPGTEALYGTELTLTAPAAEGLHRYTVTAPAVGQAAGNSGTPGEGPVHDAVTATFNIRTVPEAECVLKVVAIDREKQAPVKGAKVVVHPYRAITDEDGVAELRLPRGQYRLFVTGRDFFPLRLDGELAADTTLRAELELDVGPSDAELWS